MWICMNDGFLSIVASDKDPTKLVVRARNRDHIESVFPSATVHHDVDGVRDYEFRAFISRAEVSAAIGDRLFETNYTNFKDSVRDLKLHNAYLEIWLTMRNFLSRRTAAKRRHSGR